MKGEGGSHLASQVSPFTTTDLCSQGGVVVVVMGVEGDGVGVGHEDANSETLIPIKKKKITIHPKQWVYIRRSCDVFWDCDVL